VIIFNLRGSFAVEVELAGNALVAAPAGGLERASTDGDTASSES